MLQNQDQTELRSWVIV